MTLRARRSGWMLRSLAAVLSLGALCVSAVAREPPPSPAALEAMIEQMGEMPQHPYQADRLRKAFDVYRRLAPAQQRSMGRRLAEAGRGIIDGRWSSPEGVLDAAEQLRQLDEELYRVERGAARARRLAHLAMDTSFLGHSHYYRREYPLAFERHAEAIRLAGQTGDRQLLGRCYANRAIVRNFRGEGSLALEDWQAARRCFQDGPNRLREARARTEVGAWLLEMGELEPAWTHLRRAGELLDAAARVPPESQPAWQGMLSIRAEQLAATAGFHRKTGRPREALRLYNEAGIVARGTGARRDVQFTVEMAEILSGQGDPASEVRAERLYEIALLNSPVHEDPWMAMDSRIGYADHLGRRGWDAEAAELLDEALLVSRAHADLAHEAACLLRMGRLLLERERPDLAAALARFEECRRLAEENLRTPEALWRAHHGRGRALEALGREREALDAYEQAIAVIEGWLHGAYAAPDEAVRLEAAFWEPFEDAVALHARRRETESAFRLSERLKGALLAQTFNRSEVHRRMPAEERETDRRLRARVDDARRAYRSSAADEARRKGGRAAAEYRRELDRKLHGAEEEHRQFREALYRRRPELRTARGALGTPELREVQALARTAKTTVVSYVVTRGGVLAFVIDGRGAELRRLPVEPAELRRDARKLEAAYRDERRIRASRTVTYPRAALPLYDALILPLERRLAGASAICVIPDDALWAVPFELLWKQERDGPRYLVERLAVTYAPSAAALLHLDRRRTAGASGLRAAALINPAPGDTQGSPLRSGFQPPLALGETTALRRQLGAVILQGRTASSGAALAALRQYDLVHFGCHGRYDNLDPLRSALGVGEGLTAGDLANAEIRARLVVMAACETARGEPARGQGLLGLTWAAFVGGARACVATRWKVDDAATAALFDAFYGELRRGASEAEALRAAQLRLLHDETFGAPYYWAGVMLMGR